MNLTLKWYADSGSKARSFKVAFLAVNSTDPSCSQKLDQTQKHRCMPLFDETGNPGRVIKL